MNLFFYLKLRFVVILAGSVLIPSCKEQQHGHALVFQTDFGTKDGAVSAMKAIAYSIDPALALHDLTHEIPAYNTWEAGYRLLQTAVYWPKGTVFVSVVDPGVGTLRKSVVMRSKTGHFFVTPDNGTLSFIAESLGVDEVREIDEKTNRRDNSQQSYTFHGRDVYAFTGARLAAGIISFEEVGRLLPDSVISFKYQRAAGNADSVLGNIPILDVQYGNVWSNIPDSVFRKLNVGLGDEVNVEILKGGSVVYSGRIPFVNTFGEVPQGSPLAYLNSLMNFSLAINEGSFSETYKIFSGPEWTVRLAR
jgi:S-adenosylmethionine hydrolase